MLGFLLMPVLADNNDVATNALAGAFAAMGAVWMLVCLGLLILGLIINWVIAAKAGYSGALSLLMLIPLLNIIILLVFAFSEWPIQQQLREARMRSGQA